MDGEGGVEIPLSADIGRLCHVVTNKTVEVPARTVVLLEAALSESQGNYTEGLVEPLEGKEGIPKGLLVARALVTAVNNRVIMQVMNTGTAPAKLHCGMKLSMFSPRTTIHVVDVDDEVHPSTSPQQSAPLNFDLEESHLNEKQQKELKSLLCSFKDIFSGTGDPLGRTNVVKHAIKTQGPPIRQPMRRLPIVMKDVVNQEVEGMLKQGVIRPSNSPWSSPIVLARKQDGSWRFCVDFRGVNGVSHHDAYPLPRIDATLESLAGSKLFSTLDLAAGYWPVEVEEEDKNKTAFSTM